MPRLIFTTIKEGNMKLIMLLDIADGFPFPCIYYNGRQSPVAIRAIKAQSCKTTDARIDKSDHMFSNTNRKIHRRKQLASKNIQMYTQSNSIKTSFHVLSSSPQNQTSRFKIAIIGEKKNIATTLIYLAVQALYNSAKPLGAALKKPGFLL